MNELTPDQLENQSKQAIIALLQDSNIKLECLEKDSIDTQKWKLDSTKGKKFDIENFYYRISSAKPWYRVGLTVDGKTVTADNENQEELLENGTGFVKWITERIEYDP